MTKYDVVLVPFPFDDLTSTKVRPAVCLTDCIGPHNHIILAFITSRIPTNPDRTDIIIQATHPGFSGTGLRVPSTLLLHRMMTVTSLVIQRRLGQLPRDIQREVEERLRLLFDL